MPEVLLFYVASDQLGDEALLGEEVSPAFVVFGVSTFVSRYRAL